MPQTAVQVNESHTDELNQPQEETKNRQLSHRFRFCGLVGTSKPMQSIYSLITKVADTDSTVLIQGETGTGKGLVARAIHRNSCRSRRPFIAINCGAIPENLLESELFGHARGAFTGATSAKPGKFELANGGTIFLDEIGDMSLKLQVKLLKVLEEGEFERVGGTRTICSDVRIIAATHRDLEAEVEKGTFRRDLFYRLEVIPMKIPALRNHKSDLPSLIKHFLDHLNKAHRRKVKSISTEAMQVLMAYNWPGNVRELRNLIERLVVLRGEGEINLEELPDRLRQNRSGVPIHGCDLDENGICLNTAVTEFEKAIIIQTLEKTKWVKNQAAKLLQLNRTTLVEKIKRHKISQPESPS